MLRGLYEASLEQARGTILQAEGRYAEAIEAFRRSEESVCLPAPVKFAGAFRATCPLPGLATAYASAGARDSAIAVYERYLKTPNPWRLPDDQLHLGPTYERLAQLYDEAGDPENAVKYYAHFVEL